MIFGKRNAAPTASLDPLSKAVLKLRINHSGKEAGGAEYAIHVAALGIIASSVSNPEEVAKKALETVSINFDRWHA